MFPDLKIKNGEFDAMQLSNIPADLNGWRVYCRFSNKAGAVDTEMATITVSNGDTAAATA
jgi:glucan biosynthesis protein